MNINSNRGRFVLIGLAGISLLTGLWAGIARMGWFLPVPNSQFVMLHGPLMVVGFLGTLIGLERAVALQRWWAYAVPIFAGLGSITALITMPVRISATLAALASLFLSAVFITLYRQYPSEHFIIMALSALAWFVGNALWFTDSAVFTIVPWWVGFIAVVVIGLACSFVDFSTAIRLSGFGFLGLAVWLLRYDLAWQSVHQPGLPRFMATSLIAGYVWLALGGILWMVFAQFFSAGPRYDAMLHTIFLGFVFSMIFAHAPIILPTITGLSLSFQNIFYLHAALLHSSLILRVAGDLSSSPSLQQWAGLLNAGAILLFLLNNVRAAILGARVRSIRKS